MQSTLPVHSGTTPPAIIFWENVPGVLSTKDNAFGCFLAGLAGEDDALVPPGDKWANSGYVLGPKRAVAWRVLDAQYFGVAQRRRRVFVVASAREGFDPAAVLFEFDGVRRDTAPSRQAGKEVTGTLEASIGSSRGAGTPTAALTVSTYACDGIGAYSSSSSSATLLKSGQDLGNGCEALIAAKQWPAEVATTLDAHFGDKQGLEDQHINGGVPCLSQCLTTGTAQRYDPETETLIPTHGGHFVDVLPFDTTQITSVANRSSPKYGEPCHPIAAAAHAPAIAFEPGKMQRLGYGMTCDGSTPTLRAAAGDNQLATAFGGDIARALTARHDSSPCADRGMDVVAVPIGLDEEQNAMVDAFGTLKARSAGGGFEGSVMQPNMQVRRLTPVECERLQGFPDNYTDIKPKGKATPDGPRYKALGNSWAVPVVRWIGERIKAAV